MRSNSSLNPGPSWVTLTKGRSPLGGARAGATGHSQVRRKSIIQTRPQEPDACYASHCFFRVLSPVETFCVNGRAHATTRRRFLSHFPAMASPAWARSRMTSPRPRRDEAGHSASDVYPHAEGGTVRLRVGEPPPPARPAGPACRRQRGCRSCRRPCEPAASARGPTERAAWPGEWTSSASRVPTGSV